MKQRVLFTVFTALAWVALYACVPADSGAAGPRSRWITLLVVHSAPARGQLVVRDQSGARLATLQSGEMKCTHLRETTGYQVLTYRLDGAVYRTVTPWAPETSPGWVWEIQGIYQGDVIGPQPAEPCVP
jgi:hypothetical protein